MGKIKCSEGQKKCSPQGTCLELLWSSLPSGRWLSDGTSAPRSGLWCARFPGNWRKKKCEQATLESVYRAFCFFGLWWPAEWMNEWMNSHHSLDHLNELSACQLDSFRVSLDPDQATSFRVLGDSYRHFVLLLDPIDCCKGMDGVTEYITFVVV